MSRKVDKEKYHILICVLVVFFSNILFAQEFSGSIKDFEDNLSIVFVNVYFKGNQIGVISDIDGNYTIRKDKATKNDSLALVL